MEGTQTALSTPSGRRLLVPGQALDNLLRQLDQRLTDRDRAHRLIQPRSNESADTLRKVIEWESAHKPMLTCELSSSPVKEYIATPMIVHAYPAHNQGVESVVKKGSFGQFPVARMIDSTVKKQRP